MVFAARCGIVSTLGLVVGTAVYAARPAAAHVEPSENPRGRAVFERVLAPADGLGPDFNAVSCASCHHAPAVGGAGTTEHSQVPWIYREGDALGIPGQRFTLTETGAHRPVPLRTRLRRRTPALFGIGQLEAISDETLRVHADPLDANGDGISGRLPWRDDCFGRFGWQSSVCDISSFVEGALSRELGIDVLPRSRSELSLDELRALVAFVRSLAPPAAGGSDADGAELFDRAQCSSCHRPVSGIASVDGVTREVRAYTDLLVHQMGRGAPHADSDSRAEFRTPPLWGIGTTDGPYMHDGSAATVEDAILQHGGEASRSRERFVRLRQDEKDRLVRFVRTR